jgi:hypothetical protein
MAHGVDAPVHGMKSPPPHPPINRVRAQAQRGALSTSNHPMLPPREVRHRSIQGVLRDLTAHYAAK